MGKIVGPLVITFIALASWYAGKSTSKYLKKREYANKMLDSIITSYDKSYGILKSQGVIIDSYDSLGFDNTRMLLMKTDSLLNLEKTKRERYENIHKGNR